jgi:acetamidase/formamidase
VEIPLHPFLGCIGVAPRWGESIHTVDAGPHGGNLDCAEICSGAEIHFPVNVPGGLLMFGDAHAAQGDGELAGGALETSAQATFECQLQKGRRLRWPRIVNEHALMTLASGRPLLDVIRIAWTEMILWLEADFGYDRWDALHVLSQVGQVRICNAVSPSYTALVRFPRRLCPEAQFRDGQDADLFNVPSYPPRPFKTTQ